MAESNTSPDQYYDEELGEMVTVRITSPFKIFTSLLVMCTIILIHYDLFPHFPGVLNPTSRNLQILDIEFQITKDIASGEAFEVIHYGKIKLGVTKHKIKIKKHMTFYQTLDDRYLKKRPDNYLEAFVKDYMLKEKQQKVTHCVLGTLPESYIFEQTMACYLDKDQITKKHLKFTYYWDEELGKQKRNNQELLPPGWTFGVLGTFYKDIDKKLDPFATEAVKQEKIVKIIQSACSSVDNCVFQQVPDEHQCKSTGVGGVIGGAAAPFMGGAALIGAGVAGGVAGGAFVGSAIGKGDSDGALVGGVGGAIIGGGVGGGVGAVAAVPVAIAAPYVAAGAVVGSAVVGGGVVDKHLEKHKGIVNRFSYCWKKYYQIIICDEPKQKCNWDNL